MYKFVENNEEVVTGEYREPTYPVKLNIFSHHNT